MASPPRARPAIGANRSTKRDVILDVFQAQEGHVSAEELFSAVRRQQPTIGRATVYRALQQLVDAGLATKVDFGDGRLRYESASGRPRHSHLVCATCHRSWEFLSSDVETQLADVAHAHDFAPNQILVQIHGQCAQCRTGKPIAPLEGPTMGAVFARDALRIAIETERHGLDFYKGATRIAKDPKARTMFQQLAAEEGEHLKTLQERYRALVARDRELERRPTFLFFKGAAGDRFASATRTLRPGITDQEALEIAVRCERHSHQFFKEYGGRFEHSEGKQIFLEFAEEERQHLNLLLGELRRLRRGRHVRRHS